MGEDGLMEENSDEKANLKVRQDDSPTQLMMLYPWHFPSDIRANVVTKVV